MLEVSWPFYVFFHLFSAPDQPWARSQRQSKMMKQNMPAGMPEMPPGMPDMTGGMPNVPEVPEDEPKIEEID